MELTAERLRELFYYDPETGHFTRLVDRGGGAKKGQRAGYRHFSPGCGPNGYRRISIDDKEYYEHRLAWLYQTGELPKQIDHIDRDGSNNRWSNLRLANQSLNSANTLRANATGFRGVSKSKNQFRTMFDRKHIGCFPTAEEAHAAFVKAAKEKYGEHACTESYLKKAA
jgi:hypothetical protein